MGLQVESSSSDMTLEHIATIKLFSRLLTQRPYDDLIFGGILFVIGDSI